MSAPHPPGPPLGAHPLGAPPPLPPDGLRVVALGGLGEVGRNMAVLEHAGKLLVIDCGCCSPRATSPVST